MVQRYDKLLFSLILCVCLYLSALCEVQSEARRVHSLAEAALRYQAAPLTLNITQAIYVLTQVCERTTAHVEKRFKKIPELRSYEVVAGLSVVILMEKK